MVLLLAYPFLVATFQYVATALAFLHGMICSSVKAVQALLRLRVQVPESNAYADLLRRAQSSRPRRHARKSAKTARAAAVRPAQAPVASSAASPCFSVEAPTPSLLERANACAVRLRRLAKKD